MESIRYTGEGRLVLPEIHCGCGLHHAEPDTDVYIARGLLPKIPEILRQRMPGNRCVVTADNHTWPLAGKTVAEGLEAAGFHVVPCVVEREGEMDPDERAVGEVLLSMEKDTDFFVSVGSGCVTDITRITAARTGRPFASVGTAPSMDGYTSTVAPLLFKGLKINAPAICPRVIICDLDIMRQAPPLMFLSGVGDVLGKYIASVDWKLGSIINDEIFCPACNDLTVGAVDRVMANLDAIAARTVEGTKLLTEALILAGMTIMVIGHTRAVASAEHNIAHFWDMELLRLGKRPPRHGVCVGNATLLLWPVFEAFAKLDPAKLSLEQAKARNMSVEERRAFMLDHYGAGGEVIMRENPEDFLTEEELTRRFERAVNRFDEIREVLWELPSRDAIANAIVKLGGELTPAGIGIDDVTLARSVECAGDYRSRYTLMKTIREVGLTPAEVLARAGKESSQP